MKLTLRQLLPYGTRRRRLVWRPLHTMRVALRHALATLRPTAPLPPRPQASSPALSPIVVSDGAGVPPPSSPTPALRILLGCHQFFPEFYTGTERYTLELAKALIARGHDVSVSTYQRRDDDGMVAVPQLGLLSRRFEVDGVAVRAWRQPEGLPADLPPSERQIRAAEQLLDERPIDVLHLTHPMTQGALFAAAQRREIPRVIHLTDYWLLCPQATLLEPDETICAGPERGRRCAIQCYSPRRGAALQRRYIEARRMLAEADLVVSPSRLLMDTFERQGFDTTRFVHRPHGFPYSPLASAEGARPGSAQDAVTIGFLGTLLPHKGAHVLIETMRAVDSPNLRCRIYGSAFEQADYRRYLRRLAGADGRIRFSGEYSFEQLGDVMRELDAVVVPSLWLENAPLVISSAFAAGVPVIGSRIGGIAEMVTPEDNGFLFEPGSVEALADLLRRIAANPDELRALSRRCPAPHSIEDDAELFEQAYGGLLRREPIVLGKGRQLIATG